MLERYPTKKIHFSSDIQEAEVEKLRKSVDLPQNPLCNIHRKFAWKSRKITGFSTSATCISELKWIFLVK